MDAANMREKVIDKDEVLHENKLLRRKSSQLSAALDDMKNEIKLQSIIHDGQKQIEAMEHQRAQENTKKEFETKETEFKEREDDYAKQIAQIESEREEAKAEARRQTEASLAIIRSGGVPHGTSFA